MGNVGRRRAEASSQKKGVRRQPRSGPGALLRTMRCVARRGSADRPSQPATSERVADRACPQIWVDFCRGWVTFRPVPPGSARRAGSCHFRDACAHDRRCPARARLVGRAQPPRSGQRHPRARHGCGRGRPSPAIPACPWAWPTSPPCCSRTSCKFDPGAPDWPDRDRFVLSAGHGSMLLYALLYLTGYPDMDARGAAALPPARLAHRRPSRIRPCARHRDHHRAARPGPRQRGRHGARRAPSARPVRRGSGRPPHLRDRQRRLPDGGHQPRGELARRPSAPRPADRALRRQPHLDRRADRARPVRRRAHAVRGLRLAGQCDRRPRSRRRSQRRIGGGPGRGPADADRLPHHDRLRRADQGRAPPRPTARRSAPTRSAAARASSAGRIRRSRSRRSCWRRGGGFGVARRAGARGLGSSASARQPADVRAEFERAHARRRCRPAWTASCARSSRRFAEEQPTWATRKASQKVLEVLHAGACRSWSAARPT